VGSGEHNVRAGRAQGRLQWKKRTSKALEDGFSLVEVLLALTIVSLVVILGVGGMATLALSSGVSRTAGAAGAVVRRGTEAVVSDPYVQCSSLSASSYPLGMPASASQLPENATAIRVKLPFVAKVTSFDGNITMWAAVGGGTCTGVTSTDLQVVWVEDDAFVGTGEVAQTVRVVKGP